MKRLNLYVRFILSTAFCCWALVAASQTIIPAPKELFIGKDCFYINESTSLYTNLKGAEKRDFEEYLSTLPAPFNRGMKTYKKNKSNSIVFALSPSRFRESEENYTLYVNTKQIIITASTPSGLFYGLQSLLQTVQPHSKKGLKVPCIAIKDTPRFPYRGFMMDVSRHFRSVDFIKKQIDALARYKINRLHLHLTDAAGWRIEIKKYPRLTEFAAWRPVEKWKDWWFAKDGRKYCEEGSAGAYGGYYTHEEIRELVKYAALRHITIIPEIEMPGHSEEVLAAYPELACSGKPYQSGEFCIGNEKTFTFLEEVLTEVMALFTSEYIHIGGDEANRKVWETCPHCQARMKSENLQESSQLQSYLIHRIEKFLNAHGRKLLGWDEIVEGGLAPNATVMSWRGEEGGIKAVRAGQQTVMTPGSHCYFDAYQDAPHTQPEAMGGYLPLSKVYGYDPVPQHLTPEESKLIYGVQANLWAEYIPGDEQYEYMTYPRIMALAEVGWTFPERKSFRDFHAKALQEVEKLQARGYHPFPLKDEIGHRPESLQPIEHLGRGKKVTYNAPYNNTYSAQGESALTDGNRGDWTYSDGSWQGFISRPRMDVTVDLDSVTTLQSIEADFIQVVGPEVFLPCEIIISISNDGEQFTEIMHLHNQINRNQAIDFKTYGWHGNVQARYVRYQARSGQQYGGWIFTDEIVIK